MKRTEIEVNGEQRFIRRGENGQFIDDQVDVGRSISTDKRQQAKHTVPEGQGDRGDRKRAS